MPILRELSLKGIGQSRSSDGARTGLTLVLGVLRTGHSILID